MDQVGWGKPLQESSRQALIQEEEGARHKVKIKGGKREKLTGIYFFMEELSICHM